MVLRNNILTLRTNLSCFVTPSNRPQIGLEKERLWKYLIAMPIGKSCDAVAGHEHRSQIVTKCHIQQVSVFILAPSLLARCSQTHSLDVYDVLVVCHCNSERYDTRTTVKTQNKAICCGTGIVISGNWKIPFTIVLAKDAELRP